MGGPVFAEVECASFMCVVMFTDPLEKWPLHENQGISLIVRFNSFSVILSFNDSNFRR